MEKTVLSLFLPEGILEYFDVTSVEKMEESYTISLAEKHLHPFEYAGQYLSSKGYFEAITVSDFPIRGKACYLKVRRRRWFYEETGKIVAKGTDSERVQSILIRKYHWKKEGWSKK